MLWLYQQSYQAVPQNTAAGIDSDMLPIMAVKKEKKKKKKVFWKQVETALVNTTAELSMPA